ncbi:MAG: hypothetical protein HQL37_11395 [Alphaproteobacteria bacterium]|nr:hypothetical protein [Alphaproteobacteria bacterium]
MPLSAELEALLTTEKDATKREAMRKELEDGYRRQADYSRAMNDLAIQKKEWQTWHATVDKEYKQAKADAAQLKQTIAELQTARDTLGGASGGGGDSDTPDLDKALKEARRELTEANTKSRQLEERLTAIDQQIESGKLLTSEKAQEMFSKGLDNAGAAVFDIIDKQNLYRATYGKELDRNILILEAQKRNGDLNAAYEFVTAKDKEEKLRKDIEAEFDKKYQDKLRTSNLSIDQGGAGEAGLGPLQQRIKKQETGIPDSIPADGSGQLASAMAQELRTEGKF